jgi:acetyl esterase
MDKAPEPKKLASFDFVTALWLRKFEASRILITSPADVSVEDRLIPAENNCELPISIYRPKGVEGCLPTLFWLPGGAFVQDFIASADVNASHFAEKAKCQVILVLFRVGPENKYPIAHNDVFLIIKTVLASPKDYGVDNTSVGIGGSSGGGTLVIPTVVRAKREGIKFTFMLLASPTIDHSDEIYKTKKYEEVKEFEAKDPGPPKVLIDVVKRNYFHPNVDMRDPVVSPLFFTTEDLTGLPRTTVIFGENDGFRSHSEVFIDMLKAASVKVTSLMLEGEYHAIMGHKVARDTPAEKLTTLVARKKEILVLFGQQLYTLAFPDRVSETDDGAIKLYKFSC